MPGASAGLPSQYIDLGGGIALNPATGGTFVYDPTQTPSGQAGMGMHAYQTGTGTLAGLTAPNAYGNQQGTGIFAHDAMGLPGSYPGTQAMPNPFVSQSVPLSGMVGMMDPYLVLPGAGGGYGAFNPGGGPGGGGGGGMPGMGGGMMPAGVGGGSMMQQLLGIG